MACTLCGCGTSKWLFGKSSSCCRPTLTSHPSSSTTMVSTFFRSVCHCTIPSRSHCVSSTMIPYKALLPVHKAHRSTKETLPCRPKFPISPSANDHHASFPSPQTLRTQCPKHRKKDRKGHYESSGCAIIAPGFAAMMAAKRCTSSGVLAAR